MTECKYDLFYDITIEMKCQNKSIIKNVLGQVRIRLISQLINGFSRVL